LHPPFPVALFSWEQGFPREILLRPYFISCVSETRRHKDTKYSEYHTSRFLSLASVLSRNQVYVQYD